MRAVRIARPGGPEVLRVEEVPDPSFGPDELLVDVRAAGVNRADLLQRAGRYPAPPGAPEEIPGLEFAGTVAAAGERVSEFEPGDPVMGLLGGGGYAERVRVPAGMALRVPERLGFVEAAAVPEVFFTAHDALSHRARLAAGERVLVHAAGGGVGTAALQLARMAGAARIYGTASAEKVEGIAAAALPLDVAIDYREESFSSVIREDTDGEGVDVILDAVGGEYWEGNVESLAPLGRLVLIGLLGGSRTEADLDPLLRKRITVVGTVLRSRPPGEKLRLADEVRRRLLPAFAEGRLRPVVDRTFPLEGAAEAHRYMAANRNLGKIVLDVGAA